MNAYEKIRAALEQARQLIPEYCGIRTQYDDAFAALDELERAEAVYLVATGETYEGAETYTRHDVAPALCDCEKLYAAPAPPNCDPLGFAYEWEYCGNWFPDFSRTRPIDSPHRRNITPLYTTPPPAPVAEIREPTEAECDAIYFAACKDLNGQTGHEGREMFRAVRAVMFPQKSEVGS